MRKQINPDISENRKNREVFFLLFIHVHLSDDADEMNVFLLRWAFTATATTGGVVSESFRIRFFRQRFHIQYDKKPEKTITDTVFQCGRGTISVKNTD